MLLSLASLNKRRLLTSNLACSWWTSKEHWVCKGVCNLSPTHGTFLCYCCFCHVHVSVVLQAATPTAKSAPKANPLSAPSVIRAGASSTTIVS